MDIWLKIDRPLDIDADIPLKDEASAQVKKRYKDDWGKLIVWANSKEGTIGCIRYNRSISMLLKEVSKLELQEIKPAKGRGHIYLSFVSKEGNNLGSLGASNSKKSLDWLSLIQPLIANELQLAQEYIDLGYDA